MGRILSILFWTFLLGDLFLLFLLKSSPQSAFACHLVLSVGFFLIAFGKRLLPEIEGSRTFLLLAFSLCLLAPFVGFLAFGALLFKLGDERDSDEQDADYVLGNPMRESGHIPSPGQAPCPVIQSLGREDFDNVSGDVAYLKGELKESGVILLKRIRDHSGAMPSLHANAALTALSGQCEAMLESAEKQHTSEGDSTETCFNLGTASAIKARSGLVPREEKDSLLRFAIEQFEKCPNDEASMTAALECALELLDPTVADRFLERVKPFPAYGDLYKKGLQQVHALRGEWNSLRDTFDTIGPSAGMSFWVPSKTK